MQVDILKNKILNGEYNSLFKKLYFVDDCSVKEVISRYVEAIDTFCENFEDTDISIFSAPGRTEVGGNHTDHQHGKVLAAALNLDVIAIISKTENNIINLLSEGHKGDCIDLSSLEINEEEANHSASLIRGISARLNQLDYKIGGFNAYTTSNVLKGSGMSSSAAFEVLVGTILNHIYNDGVISSIEIAAIGQYAENVFFGKPCGLMDQTASSVGGFITIDFLDVKNPVVKKIDFDFSTSNYNLCIVDTGGSHSDLTPDYAAIPAEMKAIANYFGKDFLVEVDEIEFYLNIGKLRELNLDRGILRAIHFFADTNRVTKQVEALQNNDFSTFKKLIIESGNSSYQYLQNVFSTMNIQEQGVSIGLAVTEKILNNEGAYRVHGGGFAGTIQSFVPNHLLNEYKAAIDGIFGKGACYVLSIREEGGIKVI